MFLGLNSLAIVLAFLSRVELFLAKTTIDFFCCSGSHIEALDMLGFQHSLATCYKGPCHYVRSGSY
jgi:hypothetical protein